MATAARTDERGVVSVKAREGINKTQNNTTNKKR